MQDNQRTSLLTLNISSWEENYLKEVAADNRWSPAILDQKRLLTTGCH